MSTTDLIALRALVGSGIAILISIVSAVKAAADNRSARQIATSANSIAQGAAEMSMRSAVDAAWERVAEVRRELDALMQGRPKEDLSTDERNRLTGISNGLKFAIERVCNAYETACGIYLDNKCDKGRFRKMFNDEIRQLVQNETDTFKQVLKPGPASKFTAILKVYDDWHNLEK